MAAKTFTSASGNGNRLSGGIISKSATTNTNSGTATKTNASSNAATSKTATNAAKTANTTGTNATKTTTTTTTGAKTYTPISVGTTTTTTSKYTTPTAARTSSTRTKDSGTGVNAATIAAAQASQAKADAAKSAANTNTNTKTTNVTTIADRRKQAVTDMMNVQTDTKTTTGNLTSGGGNNGGNNTGYNGGNNGGNNTGYNGGNNSGQQLNSNGNISITSNLTYNPNKYSSEVAQVQAKLMSLGYDVGSTGADGYFGSKTLEAIQQFQADKGLAVDGIVGADTVAALNGSKKTNKVTVTSKDGNTYSDLVVNYDTNGNISSVTKEDGTPYVASPCDYFVDGDTVIYYAEDELNPAGWYQGSFAEYMGYVEYYDSLNEQDEEQGLLEAYMAMMEQMQAELLASQQEANDAAVELSVQEIEAELENGLAQYQKDAEEAYLQMVKNQQSQVLQNNYSGDLGGIGSKQYDSAQASYDAQLLSIALEKEAFINSCNQQIAQLKAEGRLQDAEILAEWAQQKVSLYDDAYWSAISAEQNQQQIDAANSEVAFNKALTMLQQGFVTADALEALGLNGSDATALNQLASYNLNAATQALTQAYQNLGNSNSGTSTTDNTVSYGGLSAKDYATYQSKASSGIPVYTSTGVKYGTFYDDGTGNGYIVTTNGSKMSNWPSGCYMELNGTKYYWSDSDGEFVSESNKNANKVSNQTSWLKKVNSNYQTTTSTVEEAKTYLTNLYNTYSNLAKQYEQESYDIASKVRAAGNNSWAVSNDVTAQIQNLQARARGYSDAADEALALLGEAFYL